MTKQELFDNKLPIFNALKEIASSIPEIVELGIFGSYAKGTFHEGSDIDVYAIVLDKATATRTKLKILELYHSIDTELDLYIVVGEIGPVQECVLQGRRKIYENVL